MKKRLFFAIVSAFALSVLMLFSTADAAAEIKIYRLKNAPVLDGVISDGEYYQLTGEDYPYTLFDNAEGDAAAAKVNTYAGYDDNYLYIGATISCPTHINEWVFVADGGENDYDIFDGHYMGLNITSVNPATDPDCIAYLLDDDFSWSDGFKSVIGRSMSFALTSDTGIQLSGVHYSHTSVYVPESDIYTDPVSGGTIRYNCANDVNLPMATTFFKVSHSNEQALDTYEVRVPWGWIDYKTDKKGNKGDNVITVARTDGSYCGIAISLATGDIGGDIYLNDGLATACIGPGGAQYFGSYIPLYLAGFENGEIPPATTTTSPTAATTASSASSTESSAVTTKLTQNTTSRSITTATTAKKPGTDGKEDGNTGLVIGIIIGAAVIIAAAAAIIIIKRKKKARDQGADGKETETKDNE